MPYKTCETCADNDNGICDRLGCPVEKNDACELHRADWIENLLQRFLSVR